MKKNTDDIRESLTKEIKNLKVSQANIKNAITKMQTQMDAMTIRMDDSQEQIRDTEDKIMKIMKIKRGKQR